MAACAGCSDKVYKAEEVLALGKAWHKSCFACQVCKKSMNPGDALDHDGMPYCKADYARYFGPKGMIQGVVVDTGLGPNGETTRTASIDMRGARPDFVDPLRTKGDTYARSGAAQSVAKGENLTEAQLAAERNRQAIRAAERAFEDDEDDANNARKGIESMRFADPLAASSGNLSGSKGKLFGGKKLDVGGGSACKGCGKPVGFADKITGMGGVWHKGTCFKCQFCNKAFGSGGDALEGNGLPTCNACYRKHFPSSRKVG